MFHHPALAQKIAQYYGVHVGRVDTSHDSQTYIVLQICLGPAKGLVKKMIHKRT